MKKRILLGIVAVTIVVAAPSFGNRAYAWGFGGGNDGGSMGRGNGIGRNQDKDRNQDQNQIQGRRGDRGMMSIVTSDVAVSACTDKAAGDDCTFTGKRPGGDDKEVSLSGTCRTIPPGKTDATTGKLSCMPKPVEGEGFGKRGDGQENRLDRASTMKQRKQAEINRIEARVQRVVDFLDSKNVDTTAIKADFTTFKSKADTVLEKVDALATLLKTDNPSKSDVETARTAVRTAGQDMITYFRNTLRPEIKKALDGLSD